jgi:hypothetical protein
MIGCQMNDEMIMIYKEVVVAWIDVSGISLGGLMITSESLRISGVQAEVQTKHLSYTLSLHEASG